MTEIEKAQEAVQRGDKVAARAVLMPLARSDPTNGEAWYLLAQVLDDPAQKQDCLNRSVANGYRPLIQVSTSVPTPPPQPSTEKSERLRSSDIHTPSPLPAAKKRSSLLPLLGGLFILLAVGAGVALYPKPSQSVVQQEATATVDAVAACRRLAVDYQAQMQPIFDEWQDQTKLAGQTSRTNLPPQISTLQTIKRKADAITLPQCAEKAHASLISSMNNTIDGFLAFMAEESDTKVQQLFANALADTETYHAELFIAATGHALPTPFPTEVPPTPTYAPGMALTSDDLAGLEDALLWHGDIQYSVFSRLSREPRMEQALAFYAQAVTAEPGGRDLGWIEVYVFADEASTKAAMDSYLQQFPSSSSQITEVGDIAYTHGSSSTRTDVVFQRCYVVSRIHLTSYISAAQKYAARLDKRIKESVACTAH